MEAQPDDPRRESRRNGGEGGPPASRGRGTGGGPTSGGGGERANGPGTNGPGTNGPGRNGPGRNGPGTNGPNGRGPHGSGADGPGADGPGAPDSDTLELLRRHREGHTDAAGRLFDRAHRRVRSIARARLGASNPLRQSIDSQDLAQEALLKAYRSLGRLQLEQAGQFVAWLGRIVENALRDHAASEFAQKRDARRRAEGGDDSQLLDSLSDAAPAPPDELVGREEAQHLLAAFERLEPLQRQVLLLRREGKTYGEIAAAVGLPSDDSARAHLKRAAHALSAER